MITNVHVDCDPLWVYAGEYGVSNASASCIYDGPLRTFLDLFAARGIRATFFVIGRDLRSPACVDFCRDAVRAGHALANHTYSHLQDYRSLSRTAKEEEVVRCHSEIGRRIGFACKGFRCPGYYFDRDLAAILGKLGYRYDSSVLPGVGVHLMKLVYRFFNPSARDKQFGRGSYLFAPRAPHRLQTQDVPQDDFWEFPIAACPLLMLPIHSTFVFQWGIRYFQFAYHLSRYLRRHFVYLFHAIDLLDEKTVGALAERVSSFKQPLDARLSMVSTLLDHLVGANISLTEDQFAPIPPARSA